MRINNKTEYQDYLKSEHWQKTRKATLADRNYRCEKCGGSGPLHVHHLTYANLGAEWPEDLQVLCEFCHRWEHFPMRRIEADLDNLFNDFKRGKDTKARDR